MSERPGLLLATRFRLADALLGNEESNHFYLPQSRGHRLQEGSTQSVSVSRPSCLHLHSKALLLAQSLPYYTNIFEKTVAILFFVHP